MSGKPEVLATVVNYRRPGNIPIVLKALRAQSVPLHVSLVECSPDTEFALPLDFHKQADSYFAIQHNLGPCSRFLPPLMLTGFDYTYFQVDDFAPGCQYVEHLLRTADALRGEFATIGQEGRNVGFYQAKGRSQRQFGLCHERICDDGESPVTCDVVTTSELCRTAYMVHAIEFRNDMIERHGIRIEGDDETGVSLFEDDLILCFGIQRQTGWPSYATTRPIGDNRSWKARRLPAPYALCARENHHELRDRFVRQAMECAWTSKRPNSRTASKAGTASEASE